MIAPLYTRSKPLFDLINSTEAKDASLVHDGREWHIFGTAYVGEEVVLLHATSPSIMGPWAQQQHLEVDVEGQCVAAPGVIFAHGIFRMYLQTTCFHLGGNIMHLTSTDGYRFEVSDITLSSIEGDEAGIYDPHPSMINGKPYLVYTGMPVVSKGDIFLAELEGWTHAKRLGKILTHGEVPHHNPLDHLDYEWGLEGAQLTELPSGKILMTAVCFLPGGVRRTRQRVFFAVADNPKGPYVSLGPAIQPGTTWDSGENGHGSMVIEGDVLHLIYQARSITEGWQYGHAMFSVKEIEEEAEQALRKEELMGRA